MLVFQALVDQIPNAQTSEIKLYVLVCRATLAVHRLAELNVILLQTVCYLKHVLTINVLIPVLAPAALMLNVEL